MDALVQLALHDHVVINDRDHFIDGLYCGVGRSTQEQRAQHNVRILPRPLVQMPRYVAFAKGDKARAERFAEALERVRASGELDRILQQWEQ